ncbi:aspartate carbamoyltransferase [Acuticoccus yangtzensis]|uniref:aspartate carbamoyltransferase n=1 Tax=Acuticoccus yangtzensis TaxID=1443441 RepID=UPI0009499353|nr:aspartate carbamoyltransferase [Acuticoccus yangtzensis]ORE93699.1 aspartate carbamoyltransferase [Stappia sp. 22II-S9-Z10]
MDFSLAQPPKEPLRHVLSSSQFDRAFLDYLCQLTNTVRRFDKSREGLAYLGSLLSHKRAMLYFTQPSTRTFLSFHSACHILGITASEIRDSATSSERKGESVEDSLRTFSSYVDLIIMRSPIAGLCERTARLLDATPRPVPIVNAGSGPDEHPTQALLDIYTLTRSLRMRGGIDGKTICMVGDLRRGRTVRSLARLLANYKDVRIIFSSPPAFRIAEDLRADLAATGIAFEETDAFLTAIAEADAIYMTRIQDEYDIGPEDGAKDYSNYHLKAEHLGALKSDAVIMHPLPRRDELDPAIDHDPRAKYWRQERNGMWVRAALLTMLFGIDDRIQLPEL